MTGKDDADVQSAEERVIPNFAEICRLADDKGRAYLRGVVDAMRRRSPASLKE